MADDYYTLDPKFTDPKRLKKEREEAQKLKKTQWWLDLIQKGICHYCLKKFGAKELTMDHIMPLARGGTSSKGNIVPACRECNRDKKLSSPVDDIFKQLEAEKNQSDREGSREGREGSDE